jgi:hypothetical protein
LTCDPARGRNSLGQQARRPGRDHLVTGGRHHPGIPGRNHPVTDGRLHRNRHPEAYRHRRSGRHQGECRRHALDAGAIPHLEPDEIGLASFPTGAKRPSENHRWRPPEVPEVLFPGRASGPARATATSSCGWRSDTNHGTGPDAGRLGPSAIPPSPTVLRSRRRG